MLEQEEEEKEYDKEKKKEEMKFTSTPIEDDCLDARLHRSLICCGVLNRLMCTWRHQMTAKFNMLRCSEQTDVHMAAPTDS